MTNRNRIQLLCYLWFSATAAAVDTAPTASPRPSPLPTEYPSTNTPTFVPTETLEPSPGPSKSPSQSIEPSASQYPSQSQEPSPVPTSFEPTIAESTEPSSSPSSKSLADRLKTALDEVQGYFQGETFSSSSPVAEDYDLPLLPFLFLAGQSNMQGWTDQAGKQYEHIHPGEVGLKLTPLLQVLEQEPVDAAALQSLLLKTELANSTIASHEASLLLDLKTRYSLDTTLLTEDPSLVCSYQHPSLRNLTKPNPMETATPMQLYSIADPKRCGEPWGLELILGKTYEKYRTTGEPQQPKLGIIKFAAGSTELVRHWSPSYEHTNLWSSHVTRRLNDMTARRLHPSCGETRTCRWTAIVWFQGENDTFDLENAESYGTHLQAFLQSLREEMFANNKTVRNKKGEKKRLF